MRKPFRGKFPTLEDVIDVAQNSFERFGIDEQKNQTYKEFLERQMEMHHEYDLKKYKRGASPNFGQFPYVRLLKDKLLLFSYMSGFTGIVTHNETKTIDNQDDLYLLSLQSIGVTQNYIENRTDLQLFRLHCRINGNIRSGWPKSIDEIGTYPNVKLHIKHSRKHPVRYKDVTIARETYFTNTVQ